MKNGLVLPAFAVQDGLTAADVAALRPDADADARALRFAERDATGAVTGTLTMHAPKEYSFSRGGRRTLLTLDAVPSAEAADVPPPRLLITSGAYAALCAAALATAPSLAAAPGGGWQTASEEALLQLIRARRIDDVLVLEQPADVGRGLSWGVAGLLNDVFGATLLPRVLTLPASLPDLLRTRRAGRRSAA